MDNTVVVAILGCIGTIVGSALGVVASSKLTNFRLEKLEEKVSKHNNLIERTFKLEEKVHQIAEDVRELKEYHK